jgi:hypothetical protein
MKITDKIENTSKILTFVNDLIESEYVVNPDVNMSIVVKNKVSGKVLFDGVPVISPRLSILNWVDLTIGLTNNIIILKYNEIKNTNRTKVNGDWENRVENRVIDIIHNQESIVLTCEYDCYKGIMKLEHILERFEYKNDIRVFYEHVGCIVDVEQDTFSYIKS